MAATVDLADLVPDLELELNTPGGDAFPTVGEEEWVGRLRNGFWTAYNDGLLQDYTENDGIVSPLSGTTAMPRDLQQLIIMYTGIHTLRIKLANLQTTFRTKAGPVEYEVQQSAQVAKSLLDDLSERRAYLLQRLADSGVARGTFYYDSYTARQDALNENLTSWVGN